MQWQYYKNKISVPESTEVKIKMTKQNSEMFKSFILALVCWSLLSMRVCAKPEIPADCNKTQVVIIGTMHKFHYESPKYTPEVLKGIILDLKPDAILNELPLSLVDPNGRPLHREYLRHPEGWAADTVAQQLGIKQIPFDRPDRNEFYRKTNYFKRQNKHNQELNKWFDDLYTKEPNSIDIKAVTLIGEAIGAQGAFRGQNLITPKIINSQLYDCVIRVKHSSGDIIPKILKKHSAPQSMIDESIFFRDVWLERNKIMVNNILKASKEYKGKRLVVITGSEHRYILRDLLKDVNSIDLKEYWELIELNTPKPENKLKQVQIQKAEK